MCDSMAEASEIGSYTIRHNLKKIIPKSVLEIIQKLLSLNIVQRQSKKTRDSDAIYTFRHG